MIKLFETDPDPSNWNIKTLETAIGGFHLGSLIIVNGPIGSGISFLIKELLGIPTDVLRCSGKLPIDDIPYLYRADPDLNLFMPEPRAVNIATVSRLTMQGRYKGSTILEPRYMAAKGFIEVEITKNRFGQQRGIIPNMRRMI